MNLKGLGIPNTLALKMFEAGFDMKYLRNPLFVQKSKEVVFYVENSYPDFYKKVKTYKDHDFGVDWDLPFYQSHHSYHLLQPQYDY